MPEFKTDYEQLLGLKLSCFVNLVVCKHKMDEYKSVINITEQILDEKMDPKNTKALYFCGYAQMKLEEFEEAVKTLEKCIDIDPANIEAKKLIVQTKKER